MYILHTTYHIHIYIYTYDMCAYRVKDYDKFAKMYSEKLSMCFQHASCSGTYILCLFSLHPSASLSIYMVIYKYICIYPVSWTPQENLSTLQCWQMRSSRIIVMSSSNLCSWRFARDWVWTVLLFSIAVQLGKPCDSAAQYVDVHEFPHVLVKVFASQDFDQSRLCVYLYP